MVCDSGIIDLGRSGDGRAENQVAVTEELRNDMLSGWKALVSRPTQGLQFAAQEGFAWHTRLHGLRDKASATGPDAVCAIYADAAGCRCWGA